MSTKLTKKQLDELDKFNNAIRGLCRLTSMLDKDNATLDSVRRIVLLAIDSNPIDPIRLAGPYIIKYKEQIGKKDDQFFLNGGINGDLAGAHKAVADVFNIITNKWPNLSPAEKNEYWKRVDILLTAAESVKLG